MASDLTRKDLELLTRNAHRGLGASAGETLQLTALVGELAQNQLLQTEHSTRTCPCARCVRARAVLPKRA